MTLRSQPCEIGPLVEKTVEGFRSVVNRGLELSGDCATDLPTMLRDPDRVRRVLADLVNDTIKFTHRGGIEVTAGREGDGVRVAVRDDGIGMPFEDRRLELFHPYALEVC